MRLFDDDKIGCYLDAIGHRIERTKDQKEIKVVDLTLRVQPFTPANAVALDPDVRVLLFSMTDGTPKTKIGSVSFRLPTVKQAIDVFLLPELEAAALALMDVEISGIRARTEKGVDGFALIFDASFGPVSAKELEYVCDWQGQQRFLTFRPQQPALDFAGKPEDNAPEGQRYPRRHEPAAAAAGQ